MFKALDKALTKDGVTVTIIKGTDGGASYVTDKGTFKEHQLRMKGAAKKQKHTTPYTPPDYLSLLFEFWNKVKQIKQINYNGHFKNGELVGDPSDISGSVIRITHFDKDLLQGILSGKKDIWLSFPISSTSWCPLCGMPIQAETNGEEIRIRSEAPCPYAGGFPPTTWELNVPSGRLAMAEDLTGFFVYPKSPELYWSPGGPAAMQQTTLGYARVGLSYAYMNNSDPAIYRTGEEKYRIVSYGMHTDNPIPNEVKINEVPNFAGWYSICDYDLLRQLAPKKHKHTTFKVKPGVYRFTHNLEESLQHAGDFARFEWIREPDPVVPYSDGYGRDVYPNAIIRAQSQRYPGLFGVYTTLSCEPIPWDDMTKVQQTIAWQKFANQLLCAPRAGEFDWHRKGFPLLKTEANAKNRNASPSFRKQYYWSPLLENREILTRTQYTKPFARLVFRVLESIISFGTTAQKTIEQKQAQMLRAIRQYRKLMRLYPDCADPEYVCWLSKKERAERWVKRFYK